MRVAFDILTVFARNAWKANRFDHVQSWRKEPAERRLDVDSGVALTKMFVLEWSIDFDCQVYQNLPMSLYIGQEILYCMALPDAAQGNHNLHISPHNGGRIDQLSTRRRPRQRVTSTT